MRKSGHIACYRLTENSSSQNSNSGSEFHVLSVLHTAHSNIARQDTALQSCPLPCGKIRKPSSDFLAEQRTLHHYDHITVHLFISRFPLAKGPLSLCFYTNVIVSFGIKHDDKNDRELQDITDT